MTRWTEAMEEKLAEILTDMADNGRYSSSFKTETYNEITNQINDCLKAELTWIQVRTHIKQAKKKFTLAKDAIKSSGYGIEWNVEHKYLTTNPISWAVYIKGKDDMLKNMRNKAFVLYDTFYRVFGESTASGTRAVSDGETDAPKTEDEVATELGDDYAGTNEGDTMDGNSSQFTQSGGTKRRNERGSSSGSNKEMIASIAASMNGISSYLQLKGERSERESKTRQDTRFVEALSELGSLGLPPALVPFAETLLATNPGYERAYMSVPMEMKLHLLKYWIRQAGFNDEGNKV